MKLSRKKMRRNLPPFLLVLFFCIFFLCAFSSRNYEYNKLTRFDLAQLIESLLENQNVSPQTQFVPEFKDLNPLQQNFVKKVISLGIMAGFHDMTFRPEEKMTTVEILNGLHKLTAYLEKARPAEQITSHLKRLLGYRFNSGTELQISSLNFLPVEFRDPDAFLDREVVERLFDVFSGKKDNSEKILKGRVLDAKTLKPVRHAYVASSGKAVITDQNGDFSLDFSDVENNSVLLLAAAENYRSLELKKDLKLSNRVVLRLKPAKTSISHSKTRIR